MRAGKTQLLTKLNNHIQYKNFVSLLEDIVLIQCHCLTFSGVGITHVVGSAIRLIVRVCSGSIYSNKFAPVHLQMYNSLMTVSFIAKFVLYNLNTILTRFAIKSKSSRQVITFIIVYDLMKLASGQIMFTFLTVSSVSGSTLCIKLDSVLT